MHIEFAVLEKLLMNMKTSILMKFGVEFGIRGHQKGFFSFREDTYVARDKTK